MRAIVILIVGLGVSACAAHPAPVAAEPPPAAEVRAPEPPITPVDDPACEQVEFPEIHSTIVVPRDMVARALSPVVHAACACSRSGDRLAIASVIVPDAGTVTATARGNAAANQCMMQVMGVGRFTPFPLRSDCIDCGPGSDAPASIAYPFTLVHP